MVLNIHFGKIFFLEVLVERDSKTEYKSTKEWVGTVGCMEIMRNEKCFILPPFKLLPILHHATWMPFVIIS